MPAGTEIYALGAKSYFGFGKQTLIGTGVAATKFQPVSFDASLQEVFEPRIPTNNARKGRFYRTTTGGKISVNGTVSGELTADDIFCGIGWGALLGNNNSVTGAGTTGYVHVFNEPDDTDTAKQYSTVGATLELLLGSDNNVNLIDFVGCFLNKLTLNIPTDGMVTFSSDWLGLKAETAGVISTPTFATPGPFEGWMANFKIGAAIGSVAHYEINGDMSFSYDNKLKLSWGHDATQYAVSRTLGVPDIMLTTNTNLKQDLTLYGYYKSNATKAVQLELTHTSLAGSSSGAYSIVIALPAVKFEAGAPVLNSADELNQPLTMRAYYDSSAGYVCKVTVTNSESGVYAV